MSRRRQWLWLTALSGAVFAGLTLWILVFGPVLINDEYAAIDYFYRIVRDGHFYPTPDKLHKPLSVLLGFFAWLSESPLGYEFAIAFFSALLAPFFYLVLQRELARAVALTATAAVILHSDFMYYSVTGSTVMPFCALAFIALWAVLRREEGRQWLWVYAVCFFLAGLLRPEAWLFTPAAVLWWNPLARRRRQWFELAGALALMGLAPVIWFGKDWLINDDLLHGIHIAVRDKAVGTGAPLSPYGVTRLFWTRLPEVISGPAAAAGVLGMFFFLRRRGWRQGLLHPFIVFPLLVSVYVWLIVYLGVWHAQRYWYFDSLFLTAFAVYGGRELVRAVRLPAATATKWIIFSMSSFLAVAFFVIRPDTRPVTAWWVLASLSSLGTMLFVLVVWGQELFSSWRPGLRVSGVVFLALFYVLQVDMNYRLKLAELREEAEKQKEMVWAAEILDRAIPVGRSDRILLPSRRNEQLNWLFRHREIPETVFFREAFYLAYFKKIDFLDLHPDWIVYLPHDFQFRGPEEMFRWLEYQDHTLVREISIDLIVDLGWVRLFKVSYPPGFPPAGPLPPIP